MYNLTNTTENELRRNAIGQLGKPDGSNYQCTLTFRVDRGKREGDRILLNWLGTGLRRLLNVDFEFRSEISKGLRYHFHGYFVYRGDNLKADQAIRALLFKWKHKYGFVYMSKGDLDGWRGYITKDSGAPEQITVTREHVEEYIKMMGDLKYNKTTIDDWFQENF